MFVIYECTIWKIEFMRLKYYYDEVHCSELQNKSGVTNKSKVLL